MSVPIRRRFWQWFVAWSGQRSSGGTARRKVLRLQVEQLADRTVPSVVAGQADETIPPPTDSSTADQGECVTEEPPNDQGQEPEPQLPPVVPLPQPFLPPDEIPNPGGDARSVGPVGVGPEPSPFPRTEIPPSLGPAASPARPAEPIAPAGNAALANPGANVEFSGGSSAADKTEATERRGEAGLGDPVESDPLATHMVESSGSGDPSDGNHSDEDVPGTKVSNASGPLAQDPRDSSASEERQRKQEVDLSSLDESDWAVIPTRITVPGERKVSPGEAAPSGAPNSRKDDFSDLLKELFPPPPATMPSPASKGDETSTRPADEEPLTVDFSGRWIVPERNSTLDPSAVAGLFAMGLYQVARTGKRDRRRKPMVISQHDCESKR